MKELNVLSIDWDYFIDASIEQRDELFPDPNDNLPQLLKSFVWANRYAENDLMKIQVDYQAHNSLLYYLINLRDTEHDCVTIVADSHRELYSAICEKNVKKVNLLNIDFHHDCYDLGDENLTCGNWLRILSQDTDLNAAWIKRKDSDTDGDLSAIGNKMVSNDLSSDIFNLFHDQCPDIIFLCRSDPWSPPHLDRSFSMMIDLLYDVSGSITWSDEPNDMDDRYTPEFVELSNQIKRQTEKLLSKYNIKK